MTDRIPITTQLAMVLIDFFCAREPCETLPQTLHLEEYIDRELVFDRGEPKDGSILVKANGQDVFELKESGVISNLEYQTEVHYCGRHVSCSYVMAPDGSITKQACSDTPQPPCNNPVKVTIAALFGEEELKDATLSDAETERAQKLRAAIGLGSSEKKGAASLTSNPTPAPSGSFFSDRWQGWRLGGEALFNHYEGPGGGSKLWIGYRKDRWDFRGAVQGDGIQLQAGGFDVRLGVSLEAIFHLLERPLLVDPYLNLPELGLYHLVQQGASGIAFSPLGAGLQFHLNDSWALYAGAKLRAAFTFDEKPKLGAEVPLGFSGHF